MCVEDSTLRESYKDEDWLISLKKKAKWVSLTKCGLNQSSATKREVTALPTACVLIYSLKCKLQNSLDKVNLAQISQAQVRALL